MERSGQKGELHEQEHNSQQTQHYISYICFSKNLWCVDSFYGTGRCEGRVLCFMVLKGVLASCGR